MERSTRQRLAIRQVLEETTRPLLADEIWAAAREQVPSLGMATVYRTIKRLVSGEDLKTVELPGQPPRYEFVHTPHHHFSCHICGLVYDVQADPSTRSPKVPPNFKVERLEITLYGTCPSCQEPLKA